MPAICLDCAATSSIGPRQWTIPLCRSRLTRCTTKKFASQVFIFHVEHEGFERLNRTFHRLELRKGLDFCPRARLRARRIRPPGHAQRHVERRVSDGVSADAKRNVPLRRVRTARKDLPDELGQPAHSVAQLQSHVVRYDLHGKPVRRR